MTTTDRLSDLSDDLLRRILHFVPSNDAARTSSLSRRWGSLWRSSGAVNLAVQVQGQHYGVSYEEADDALFRCQEDFVRGAKAALDAATAPVSRLTLLVESKDGDLTTLNQFLRRSRDWGADPDVVGALVSHPSARHVEELRLAAVTATDSLYLDQEIQRSLGVDGEYTLASLPSSDTLRVLDLTRCDLRAAAFPSSSPFPRLATLRLRFCTVEPRHVLQALLDGAPALATVHLESLVFSLRKPQPNEPSEPPAGLRLSLQAVTTLVLSLCSMEVQGWDIEIDAPRLQSFRYKGLMRGFVLRSAAASSVARVDLHFLPGQKHGTMCVLFWQFLRNFTNARTVKLKVDNDLADIAVVGEASDAGGLLRCVFPRLERLELEGAFSGRDMEDEGLEQEEAFSSMDMERHEFEGAFSGMDMERPGAWERHELEGMDYFPEGEEAAFPSVERLEGVRFPERGTAAVAIANLLDCCPVLGEFVLKMGAVPVLPDKDSNYLQEFLKRRDRSDYSKSIDLFVRRRQKSKTGISMGDSFFGGKYSYDRVRDIRGLSGRSFACLQRTLRRVGLQFRLDNNSISRCLGLQLIKFFAGHARVLEEMYVDTGNRKLYEHLNFNVETQTELAPTPISSTASIHHMNLAGSSSEFSRNSNATCLDSTIDLAKSTARFTVLPLQRQERMDSWKSSLEN